MHNDAKHDPRMHAPRRLRLRIASATLAISCLLSAGSAVAATFVVTSAADSGPGSLRQAMEDANANLGMDTVTFNIPGPGPHTIEVLTALPTITDGIRIDGFTQPGSVEGTVPTLQVALFGGYTEVFDGIRSISGDCTIRGLAVGGFRTGIRIVGGPGAPISGVLVEGCRAGTDVHGASAVPNYASGIFVRFATNVTVRGNLASGNGADGVFIVQSSIISLTDNRAGTDASGTVALGNGSIFEDSNGILVQQSDHAEVSRNLISGSLYDGMFVGLCDTVLVTDNLIGTDITGQVGLGNTNWGLGLVDCTNLTATGNVVAASGKDGVLIGWSSQLVFARNLAGTNATGDATLPNDWNSVIVYESQSVQIDENVIGGGTSSNLIIAGGDTADVEVRNNTIGVSADGTIPLGSIFGQGILVSNGTGIHVHDNKVAHNFDAGIFIDGTPDVRVERNAIFANGTENEYYPAPGLFLGFVNGVSVLENQISGNTGPGINLFIADGSSIVGNEISGNVGHGIDLVASSGNVIEGNELHGNESGVHIGAEQYVFPDGSVFGDPPGRANSILANSIHDNAGAGIELDQKAYIFDEEWNVTESLTNSGPDTRDLLDVDSGPNDFLNRPILQTAILKDGVLTAKGNLKGLPGSTQTVQVFASSAADPSGSGEGDIYLGLATVTTNADGNVHFNLPVDGSHIAPGVFITATTTDSEGNTSEFSNAVVAKPAS